MPCGCLSQDGAGRRHGFKPMGGWRFGNTIDGTQAEYRLVPDAMTNLAPIPDALADEQVLMCPTSCRPASPVPRAEGQGSATLSRSSHRDRSDFADGWRTADGRDHGNRRGYRPRANRNRAQDGRRPRRRPRQDGPGRGDPSPDRRLRRRRGDRSVGSPRDSRGGIARPATGKHPLVSWCLFERRHHDPARSLPCRARRSNDRHHAMPGRQGTHAAADGGHRGRSASTRSHL